MREVLTGLTKFRQMVRLALLDTAINVIPREFSLSQSLIALQVRMEGWNSSRPHVPPEILANNRLRFLHLSGDEPEPMEKPAHRSNNLELALQTCVNTTDLGQQIDLVCGSCRKS